MNYQAIDKIKKALEFNRSDALIQLSHEFAEEFRASGVVKTLVNEKNFSLIDKLINSGAWNVNDQDVNGKTLAHYAASNSDISFISKKLVPIGADLNILDNNGSSPLHYAAMNDAFFADDGNIGKVLSGYVSLGSRLDIKNKRGETVMDIYNRIRPNIKLDGDSYGAESICK